MEDHNLYPFSSFCKKDFFFFVMSLPLCSEKTYYLCCTCSVMHNPGNLCKAYTRQTWLLTLLGHVSLFIILTTSNRKEFSNHVSIVSLELSFYSQAKTLPGLQEHLVRDYQSNGYTN